MRISAARAPRHRVSVNEGQTGAPGLHPTLRGRAWLIAQPLSKVRAQAEINVCMCSRPGSGACRMQSCPVFIRLRLGSRTRRMAASGNSFTSTRRSGKAKGNRAPAVR